MRDNYGKNKRIIFIWVLFSLWVLGLHLVMGIGGQTDDVYYREAGTAVGFTYGQWIKEMWSGWSSRLIINCLSVFFNVVPHIIWRIFNTAVIFVVPFLLWKMSDVQEADKGKSAVLACALFLMMPYVITGEAGWIVTALNYSLPASGVLICMYMLWKVSKDKKIAGWEWAGYFAAACVATDAEQGCIYLLAVLAGFCIWMIYNGRKRYRAGVMGFAVFSVLRMVMIFICPGNLVRKGLVIKENYPEYGKLGLFDKFLAGIYSVSSDFFLVFISLTFVMLLLICLLVWKKHREWWKRLISAIPVSFTITVPLIVGKLVYEDHAANVQAAGWGVSVKNVMTSMGILGNFNLIWDKLPLYFYVGLVVVFVSVFISIWWALEGSRKYITGLLLLLGCCTKGAMGFTGSVWLSHSRTGYYLVLTEIFVIIQLYTAWRNMKKDRVQKWFLYLVSVLAVLNAFVSYALAAWYIKF